MTTMFTTAPESMDHKGTCTSPEQVECVVHGGRRLRRVETPPENAEWQRKLYKSFRHIVLSKEEVEYLFEAQRVVREKNKNHDPHGHRASADAAFKRVANFNAEADERLHGYNERKRDNM